MKNNSRNSASLSSEKLLGQFELAIIIWEFGIWNFYLGKVMNKITIIIRIHIPKICQARIKLKLVFSILTVK